ncbi:response regulator [Deinococcus multiflagellatus]|uniref:Response regulator n=1 Tax=Deinococcus multiflagellatus TaxID=1656887 RepID=A0ABW1ZN71_9DEIO|nr:response regulator [Deinococcus multiflagellatus]MBZ9715210.1 response regulator [Deinococcus multiflagellatus]
MTSTSSRLHVLLIDDDPADRLLAQEAFEEHAGTVQISLCEDGVQALAWLRTPGRPLPDVVMLDLNMPRMSGFEVIAAIRSDPGLRHLPVVILSTSDNPDDVAQAYNLFASSYMVKSKDFPGFLTQVDHFVKFWQDCRFKRLALPLSS